MPGRLRTVAAGLFLLVELVLPAALAQEAPYTELTGRVVDAAGILPPEVEGRLSERLAREEREGANQVVVATVPSLGGADVESYANGLFRHWELGQREWNNGVLLLVAPGERKIRIEVGYGLEGELTDALASDIIRNRILPAFRQGDFPAGIEAGIEAIIQTVHGAYEPLADRTAEEDPVGLFILTVIVVILVVNILRAFFGSGGSRGRGIRRRSTVWGVSAGGTGSGWSSGGEGRGFRGGGGSSGGGGASGSW